MQVRKSVETVINLHNSLSILAILGMKVLGQNLIPLQISSFGPLRCWDLSHSSVVNEQEEPVDFERFFVISPQPCLMEGQFGYAAG